MLRGSMSVPRLLSFAVLALAFSAPAFAADKTFEEPKFGFTFAYDPTWIPAVQTEGESVTFTLSEGEVHVAVQRDPNARHHKSRAALAEDLIRTWKGRLSFDKLEPVETKLGGLPATLVQGNGKLFDDPTPYRLSLYVVERDSKLYTVKFSGLFDLQPLAAVLQVPGHGARQRTGAHADREGAGDPAVARAAHAAALTRSIPPHTVLTFGPRDARHARSRGRKAWRQRG
jgi:hypothetical protein